MEDPTQQYEISGDEESFVKILAQEYVLVQMIRRIANKIFTPEELRDIIEQSVRSSEVFNETINNEGDPQTLAWKKLLSNDFNRIYGAIASNDKSWDDQK